MIPYLDVLSKHWLPICKASRIKKKPISIRILNENIVLFRAAGKLSALRDRCPHRNVPLSKGRVTDSYIQCSYHGWKFDASGICQHIPGLEDFKACKTYKVPAYPVHEKNGVVWIRLRADNVYDTEWYIPSHIKDDKYDTRIWTKSVGSSLLNTLENFLDGTHTHFVHPGLIRFDSKRKIIPVEIKPTCDKIEVIYKNEGRQNGFISKLFEPQRHESKASFTLPCIATLEYTDKNSAYFAISAYMVPESETKVKIFAFISHKRGIIPGLLKHLLTHPFFLTVFKQDRKILELQQTCIEQFGAERFIIARQDLIRPYAKKLLSEIDISDIPKSVMYINL